MLVPNLVFVQTYVWTMLEADKFDQSAAPISLNTLLGRVVLKCTERLVQGFEH
jgi:hypothetical protein